MTDGFVWTLIREWTTEDTEFGAVVNTCDLLRSPPGRLGLRGVLRYGRRWSRAWSRDLCVAWVRGRRSTARWRGRV